MPVREKRIGSGQVARERDGGHHPQGDQGRRHVRGRYSRPMVATAAGSGRSARQRGAVVVVGSVSVDLTAAVSPLPRPGETVVGSRFSTVLGGKGANQAV